MDLYRTFPNLPYLTVGRSLPWTPGTATWTLTTVSTHCCFGWGCRGARLARLSNLRAFYLRLCTVLRESCLVAGGWILGETPPLFPEVKNQGAVALQLSNDRRPLQSNFHRTSHLLLIPLSHTGSHLLHLFSTPRERSLSVESTEGK